MLYGRDADAVDITDGTIGEAQTREDAELHVLLAHCGILLSQTRDAVAIDGIEGVLHLSPLALRERHVALGTALELLNDLRALQDEVLEERDCAVALSELLALGCTLLLAQLQFLSVEACLVMAKPCLMDAFIHFMLTSPSLSQSLLTMDAQPCTNDEGGSDSQQDGNGESAPEGTAIQR